MKCENVQDLIAEYRSNALEPDVVQEFESHIANCADCRRELEEFDAVVGLVDDNFTELEAPVGLWNGVYNRITEPEQKPSIIDRLTGGWIRTPARALGFGAAVLVLVAGLMFNRMQSPQIENMEYTATDNRYVQAHALTAGTAPLADRASYISYVAMSQESASGEKQ